MKESKAARRETNVLLLFWLVGVFAILFYLFFLGTSGGQQMGDPLYQGDEGRLGFKHIGLNAPTVNGVTLTGVSQFNTNLTGVSHASRPATAGISVWVVPPTKGTENMIFFNRENTLVSGNTLYVVLLNPGTGVTACTNLAYTPGVSRFVVSGTAMSNMLGIFAIGATEWGVKASGTLTVENR